MGLLYVKTADGRKKPSIWVWLTLLLVLLGISVALVYNPTKSGLDQMKEGSAGQKRPAPIDQSISDNTSETMDGTTKNELDDQLRREKAMNNGYLPPEREQEIRKRYEGIAEERRNNNFQPTIGDRLKKMTSKEEEEKKKVTPTPETDPGLKRTTTYKTLAERLAEESGTAGGGGGNSQAANSKGGKNFDFGVAPTHIGKSDKDPQKTDANGHPIDPGEKEKAIIKNIMPLGTFIPCVLDGDVVTSELQSYVWANVVVDVTFRRQLQLPKGLVRVRGSTASKPVQNTVDIVFDTMLFSDGTELPISGFAYSAFDPRYPHRFRTRGIPGELIVPPMWVKAQQFLYTAAIGASDAYIQNEITRSNTNNGNLVPTTSVDPLTGETKVTYSSQNSTGQENIGKTLGLGATQAGVSKLVEELLKDLEKYQPYVIIEKGTPLFIQLDETVDVDKREVNGTAKRKMEILQQNYAAGIKPEAPVYAPGDARAKYTGYSPSVGSPVLPTGGTSTGGTGGTPTMNDGVINGGYQAGGGNTGGTASSAEASAISTSEALMKQLQKLQDMTPPNSRTTNQNQNSQGTPVLTPQQLQQLLENQ